MKNFIFLLLFFFLLMSCSNSSEYEILREIVKNQEDGSMQFSLIPKSKTFIDFKNTVKETEDLNFLNFANIYNGGGVAIADFNNDGLNDIYFTANQLSDRLYLNKGDFSFEDITKSAGVEDVDGWTTGVSVVDINNDGWFDIYVCKSGSMYSESAKNNKLYINQKDNTFKEMAKKWLIDDDGFSTQSYFFDFDKDGDLDMYLVNHRPDFNNSGSLNVKNDSYLIKDSSDKLYRNEGKFFKEITQKAGLANKAWGLSASIGDFNDDNWPDVYVCNDFLSPDMLYINNQDGTFTNQILDIMNHVSFSSMGSDFADINNDLLPDLLVLEMAAEDHIRSKRNMATMSTENFNNLVKAGYHYQYMVNTFQLNQGNGNFSEIGQMSGLAKTDWSWSPLIVDLDNDGYKDVFITNGILKEMADQDFRNNMKDNFGQKKRPSFEEVTNMLSSTKLSNYIFKNNTDYTFSNVSKDWGLDIESQSNGVSYGDLDNDGDLDLIINNINDEAYIYKNNSNNNFIQINLIGDARNRFAIGSKVTILVNGSKQYQELYLSRGFISSVQNTLNFGVGKEKMIDEIIVEWPDEQITSVKNVSANQIISIDQNKSIKKAKAAKRKSKTLLAKIEPVEREINFKHQENDFDNFKNQILLPYSQSNNGPFIGKSDVNGDQLEDFFIGGASGQSAELYLQTKIGKFTKQLSDTWMKDKKYEDLGVLFFDADNDGDQDLYVVSGGSEFTENSNMYQDRIYFNNGKGQFTKEKNVLPEISSSGQCIKASDIDNDGDLDLFIGGRIIPDKYPFAPESYILVNENGIFINKTNIIAPKLSSIGMVTDASFSDYDNDGDDDLIIVGEWMPISVFENIDGKFVSKNIDNLQNSEGIWFSIAGNDIDDDGDIDYFVGNLGLNSKFKANSKKEFHIFCDDFDGSGTFDIVLSNKYNGTLVPARGKECSTQQMPFIENKFPSYQSFAEASLVDIYGENNLENAIHYESKLLHSVFLENLGNGDFKLKKLPNLVQVSPIMDFEFVDIDNNGYEEVLVVGNHYNTEVETVRYDASFGAVLSYSEGNFTVLNSVETGFVNKGDAKNIEVLNVKNSKLIIVTNNNEMPGLFEVKN